MWGMCKSMERVRIVPGAQETLPTPALSLAASLSQLWPLLSLPTLTLSHTMKGLMDMCVNTPVFTFEHSPQLP